MSKPSDLDLPDSVKVSTEPGELTEQSPGIADLLAQISREDEAVDAEASAVPATIEFGVEDVLLEFGTEGDAVSALEAALDSSSDATAKELPSDQTVATPALIVAPIKIIFGDEEGSIT